MWAKHWRRAGVRCLTHAVVRRRSTSRWSTSRPQRFFSLTQLTWVPCGNIVHRLTAMHGCSIPDDEDRARKGDTPQTTSGPLEEAVLPCHDEPAIGGDPAMPGRCRDAQNRRLSHASRQSSRQRRCCHSLNPPRVRTETAPADSGCIHHAASQLAREKNLAPRSGLLSRAERRLQAHTPEQVRARGTAGAQARERERAHTVARTGAGGSSAIGKRCASTSGPVPSG